MVVVKWDARATPADLFVASATHLAATNMA